MSQPGFTLAQIARALDGEVSGGQVLAPGPGHSRADRSLCVRLSAGAQHGFVLHSHSGDDWQACRDYVASKLGVRWAPDREQGRVRGNLANPPRPDNDVNRSAQALRIWEAAVDPRGTVVETYLASRGIALSDNIAGRVLRFHPACPFGPLQTAPCMVAAYRSIETGDVVAIHRTALTLDGAKIGRQALGPKAGAAIMFDELSAERGTLGVGEGIETTLSGRQMGYAPAWAMGDAGGIAKLPVLAGVDSLAIFAENDESGTNQRASDACGSRWHAAGREVFLVRSRVGKDLNDALRQIDGTGAAPIDVETFRPSGDAEAFIETDAAASSDERDEILPLDSVSASWLMQQPLKPRAWHVPELIPGGTVTMLSGDGATGKSLIALQLAVATALGKPWLGHMVDQGGALFITAEDELSEAHLRLNDICAADGLRPQDLDALQITSLAGRDALLAVPDARKGGALQSTLLFQRVGRLVDLAKPKLVVLDTLADLFGGNEIDRAQARQFIGLLRGLAIDYATTVLLLGHPSLAGMASGTGLSGSTAWNNSVRSRLYLRRILQQDGKSIVEPDADLRLLSTVKANYGRAGTEFTLRWRDGRFVPDRQDAGVSSFAAGAAKSRADRIFMELLATYTVEGRPVSSKPGPTYAPRTFANDERAEGVTSKGFADAMNRLFGCGEITNIETGPPSKLRSHIERCSSRGTEADEAA